MLKQKQNSNFQPKKLSLLDDDNDTKTSHHNNNNRTNFRNGENNGSKFNRNSAPHGNRNNNRNASTFTDNHNNTSSHNNGYNTNNNTMDETPAAPSSRIIVKNLPKYINEARLKTHFSSFPTDGNSPVITDVKLMKTKQGTFRRFAFLGFTSQKDAEKAVEYFNNTFLDTSKLEVGFAKEIGDPSLPRPWSKYSQGSSGFEVVEEKKSLAQELEEKKARIEKLKQIQLSKEKLAQEALQTKTLLNQLYSLDDDPKLQEFLDLVKPSSKSTVWGNDDVTAMSSSSSSSSSSNSATAVTAKKDKKDKKNKKDKKEKKDSKSDSDDKLHVAKSTIAAVPAKRPGGEGVLFTKTHLVFDDEDSDNEEAGESDDEYQDLPTNGEKKNNSDDGDQDEEEDEDDNEDQEEDQDENENQEDNGTKTQTSTSTATSTSTKPQLVNGKKPAFKSSLRTKGLTYVKTKEDEEEERLKELNMLTAQEDDESIAETGRLFLRNLAYTCTEDDLIELFSPFGPLAEVHIPIDSSTKKPKGIAFVLFLMPEHAVKAYEKLDGTTFQGRLLHLLPAKEQVTSDDQSEKEKGGVDAEGKSYKQRKQSKQKSTSVSDFNWNSLFIGNNTVAEAISAKYGVDKSELLDPEAGSLAVRMALAESQIIAETKQFLEDQGIKLDGANNASKSTGIVVSSQRQLIQNDRSRTILLVKNIPFSTQQQELYTLFAQYGELKRVALPPTKAIAVVEFKEPSEARTAFRHLAYAKFKHVPLYLEWAPYSAVSTAPSDSNSEPTSSTSTATSAAATETETKPKPTPSKQKPSTTTTTAASSSSKPPIVSGEQQTLFVKNLNFATTDEGLANFFSSIGEVVSATVAKKKDMQRPGQLLSMGYGFVQYASKQLALEALKKLQGQVLDDHALELKLSQRTSETTVAKKRTATEASNSEAENVESTKLLVRNVPFEANRKELFEIFSPFGQIKNLRLPQKVGGQHRGFAFVEFLTKQDAKNAFESLKANHFYGRHLVIEWAADESSIDAIREKTAAKFGTNSGPRKRTRLDLSSKSTNDDDE